MPSVELNTNRQDALLESTLSQELKKPEPASQEAPSQAVARNQDLIDRKKAEVALQGNIRNLQTPSTEDSLRKAAEQGHRNAQFSLGTSLFYGMGIEKNLKEAAQWFLKAAEQGLADAQFYLGLCYDFGLGVKTSHQEAVNWYLKAAEQGNVDAQLQLGACYALGKGVKRDKKEALAWWQKAADQGQQVAQFIIAGCYYYGIKSYKQDYAKAVSLFQKSAEQGLAEAQYRLGKCYAKGRGVVRDKEQAEQWLQRAAAGGRKQGGKNFIGSLIYQIPAYVNSTGYPLQP